MAAPRKPAYERQYRAYSDLEHAETWTRICRAPAEFFRYTPAHLIIYLETGSVKLTHARALQELEETRATVARWRSKVFTSEHDQWIGQRTAYAFPADPQEE